MFTKVYFLDFTLLLSNTFPCSCPSQTQLLPGLCHCLSQASFQPGTPPQSTGEDTDSSSLNFVPPRFGTCLFPKSRSQVYIPNVPPHLCVWDTQRHLKTPQRPPLCCPLSFFILSPTEQRHELCLPSKKLFLPSQQRHEGKRSCLGSLASQTFPLPYHSQLIFPPRSPRVLSIKAADSAVLWCAVKLPCVCSAWLPHLSLLSLRAGTSSITASLEPGVRAGSVLLPQPRVVWTLPRRSLCPQAVFFFFPFFLFFSRKWDFFLHFVPNQESRIENQTSKFNWLCLMEGILICSLWPLSIIDRNKDPFLFHICS